MTSSYSPTPPFTLMPVPTMGYPRISLLGVEPEENPLDGLHFGGLAIDLDQTDAKHWTNSQLKKLSYYRYVVLTDEQV